MKILYVISSFNGGGAESQLFSFCRCLRKKYNHSFSVCALKTGGAFETKFHENEIDYKIFHEKSLIKNVFKLKKIIKQGKYDIVHAHMLFADIVCRLATIGTKTKVVATHHGLGKWKKQWLILLDKLTKKRVSHFIMVSQKSYEIRQQREKYPIEKMSVIYNGIDSDLIADFPRKLKDDKIIFGSVARFTQNKQMNYLVEVLNYLKEDNRLYLEFVGCGEEEKNVRTLVVRYGLGNRVKFHGWSDDVRRIISNWDFFMLCSVNEDFPVSMLEAMGNGLVPIASNVGGIPYILEQGKLGTLCDNCDFKSFAEGLRKYISDSNLYEETSKGCIERIKNDFLINVNVERCISVYKRILEKT